MTPFFRSLPIFLVLSILVNTIFCILSLFILSICINHRNPSGIINVTMSAPYIIYCIFLHYILYLLKLYTVSPYIIYCISLYYILYLLTLYTVSPYIIYCISLHYILYLLTLYTASPYIIYCISLHYILYLPTLYTVSPYIIYCISYITCCISLHYILYLLIFSYSPGSFFICGTLNFPNHLSFEYCNSIHFFSDFCRGA